MLLKRLVRPQMSEAPSAPTRQDSPQGITRYKPSKPLHVAAAPLANMYPEIN